MPYECISTEIRGERHNANKFFSIGVTEESKMAKFDDSPYDTKVLDEIFFYNIRNLTRIKRYCESNPEKIIIATRDTNQLETTDVISKQFNYDEYTNYCINSIFVNLMNFKEIKRLEDNEDKEILKQFQRDIFDESIPILKTIREYFKFSDQLVAEKNIAYTGTTCKRVSEMVRKRTKKMG